MGAKIVINGQEVELGGGTDWTHIPPRPNILDNWYFTAPINQYGETSYNTSTRSNAYTIDRWKLISGTLTVDSNGCTLNGTLVQILENPILGETITATALATDGPVTAAYDNASKTFTITAANKKLIAAKLEVGGVQTLYHMESGTYVLNDPPPNPAEMLARCQRYQVELNYKKLSYPFFGIVFVVSPSIIRGMIPLPVTLCNAPVTIKISGNVAVALKNNVQSKVTSISVDGASSNLLTSIIDLSTVPDAGSVVYLLGFNDKSSRLFIDANL